jgi:hypothetical protein
MGFTANMKKEPGLDCAHCEKRGRIPSVDDQKIPHRKPYLEPYFCGQAFIASMCFCARTAAYLYKSPISVISNFSFLFDWLSIILLTIDNCTLCHKSPIWLNWTMIILTAVWDSGHPPFMRLFTQPHDHAQWPRDYSHFSPRFLIDMPTVSSLPHFNNCKW